MIRREGIFKSHDPADETSFLPSVRLRCHLKEAAAATVAGKDEEVKVE